MSIAATALMAAAGFGVGVAIGSTAIGGVLLAPLLVFVLGLPVHAAVAVALWCFLWSGLIAIWLFARRGTIAWRPSAWLWAGATPGAWAGVVVGRHVPPSTLQALIAVTIIVAGISVLRPTRSHAARERAPRRAALAGLGAVAGFGAAMLGAGGALILTPILVAMGFPVLAAIGLGQAIQLPISITATLAHVVGGTVDLRLGLWLSAALILGIACGVPMAHALPAQALRRLLAGVMIVSGVVMLLGR